MKKIIYYIIFIILCQGCTNPAQQELPVEENIPREEAIVPETVQNEPETLDMYIESEYEYTIIGSWFREFDGHVEEYVFTKTHLLTYCDDLMNGTYDIVYDAGWSFWIGDVLFEYELLHSDGVKDALVLNGYVYRRVENGICD